jgi:hypothetical protein
MNWTTIFNPFAKFSDKVLMLIGVISFLIGCFISWRFQVLYDGVLDAHTSDSLSYVNAFTSNAINVIVMCVLLFILGKIINPKTRMIDLLNASFLYRIPIYLVAMFSRIPALERINESVVKNIGDPEKINMQVDDIGVLIVFSIVSLCLIAYSIVLLVNGFKTASNAKKWQHFVSFGFVVIVAEIISKMLIGLL